MIHVGRMPRLPKKKRKKRRFQQRKQRPGKKRSYEGLNILTPRDFKYLNRFFMYKISNGTHVKIGYSNNPAKRLVMLQTSSPTQLVLVGVYDVGETREQAIAAEKQAHKTLRRHRVRGEWFKANDTVMDYEPPTLEPH